MPVNLTFFNLSILYFICLLNLLFLVQIIHMSVKSNEMILIKFFLTLYLLCSFVTPLLL